MSALSSSPAQTRHNHDRIRRLESGYTIEGVVPGKVPFHTEDAAPLIQEACDRTGGLTDARHLLYACLLSECQLWLIRDESDVVVAAIVTEIRSHPRKKSLHVLAVGGQNMAKWSSCLLEIEAWAEGLGCEVVNGDARPGWAKEARKLGYKTAAYVFHKELNPVKDDADGQGSGLH